MRTNTAVVEEAHKSVLEFILANHPLDCPICDQGGRCDLQDFSHRYTPTKSDFLDVKRVFQKEYFSPLIDKEMNRCVQCLRCVRYCDALTRTWPNATMMVAWRSTSKTSELPVMERM